MKIIERKVFLLGLIRVRLRDKEPDWQSEHSQKIEPHTQEIHVMVYHSAKENFLVSKVITEFLFEKCH